MRSRRARTSVGWLLAASLVPACYGGRGAPDPATQDTDGEEPTAGEATVGADDGSGGGDDGQGPFACDPDAPPQTIALRRLSRAQYDNSIRDLLTWAAADAGEAIHANVGFLIDRLPADARRAPNGEVRGGFRRLDQDVHQEHINAGYDVAQEVARQLTTEQLELVAGPCATDTETGNDAACVEDFIRTFGARALRRPLTDAQLGFYRSVFDAGGVTQGMDPAAFADVVVVMLTAPQFLYMVEHGVQAPEGEADVYGLDSWELASRLSYHFWQTSPDDELIEAAASGALETEDGYAAQVERMFAHPRTRAAFESFYREWLWLEDLPPLDARVGTAVFDAFRGDFEPMPESTANMIQEVVDAAGYYTHETQGSFDDFFASTQSFATTPDLAEIYGAPVWDGGEPPAFGDPERVGLVGRAALLATGSPNTRPIMKGVFIRKALLCESIPPPPDNANATPPGLAEDATTREVVEGLTEQPGTACAGCHATLINPLGFATENFDALGRFRTEQVLFDENGVETGRRPVDATSVPGVEAGDTSTANGSADLTELLRKSERVHACFARHYVRWTFGRSESIDSDGCMLNGLTSSLVQGVPMAEGLRQLALRREFKTRLFEQ